MASSSSFPAVSNSTTPPTQFHVADQAAGKSGELIAVTNVSGTTWTVTRGAENTTPVAHTAGFTIYQVVTAGGMGDLPQWYNVRSSLYGAKGDGTTVDTTAVQAACTAAIAAGGGTVYFPEGTYVISGVHFGSNLTVCGAGIGNTVLLMDPAASTNSVVCRVSAGDATAASNVVLQDLTIDGNKSNWGSNSNQKNYGYYLGAGSLGTVSNCKAVNVEIRNCLTYAFDLLNVSDITLLDCWAHDNGYTTGTGTNHQCDGFSVFGNDLTLIGCRSYSNSGSGYNVGLDGATFYRCNLLGCVAGANQVHGATLGVSSTGNLYDSSVAGGSYISGVTGAGVQLTTNAQRCTVTGATAAGNQTNGIRLSGATWCTVTGCTVSGNAQGGTSNPEIYLLNTAAHNTVTGCTVSGTTALNAVAEQSGGTNDYNSYTGNNLTSASTVMSLTGTHSQTANNIGWDPQIKTVTTTNTTAASDSVTLCNASGGAFTNTLPDATAVTPGVPYVFKKTDATVNEVTLATVSSQTVDAASYYVLAATNATVTLRSDGSNWWVF